MENYEIALDRLRKYDMSTFPYEEVKNDMGLFGAFGCMGIILNPGKTMIRARPSEAQPFNCRGQLVYPPKEKNVAFRRASTPNQTMFYAAILPDEVVDEDIKI